MMRFSTAGLETDDFETILAEVQEDFRAAFGGAVAASDSSFFGRLQRLIAQREAHLHEAALVVWQAFDPRSAEGVSQDRINVLIGLERLPAASAEVLGTATGTPATEIPDGFQVSCGGVVFEVAEGPYTIGGGGTVANVLVVAVDAGTVDVSLLGAWTLVDSLSGLTAFDDTSQPVAGRLVETHTEFRTRAEAARFARAAGSLAAIEAAALAVEGVTYARGYHNTSIDPTDEDGIPIHSINMVVVGGTAAEVAAAIYAAAPAGILLYGSDETETVEDDSVSFDRVAEVDLHVEVTVTTSTAEVAAPADLEAMVQDLIVAFAAEDLEIGVDVRPYRFVTALGSIEGVDNIAVRTSLDGAAWSTAKRSISMRQQAMVTVARVTVIEV